VPEWLGFDPGRTGFPFHPARLETRAGHLRPL